MKDKFDLYGMIIANLSGRAFEGVCLRPLAVWNYWLVSWDVCVCVCVCVCVRVCVCVVCVCGVCECVCVLSTLRHSSPVQVSQSYERKGISFLNFFFKELYFFYQE